MTSLTAAVSPLSNISNASNASSPVSKKRKSEAGEENEQSAKRSRVSSESTLSQKKIKQIKDPVEDLLKLLRTSKTAEALWNEAQKTVEKMKRPAFKVGLISPEELPDNMGICIYAPPEILIRSDCTKHEKLTTLVFELHNMLQIEKVTKWNEAAAKGQIVNKEEYAEGLERIEYESITAYTKTMLKCAHDGWNSSFLLNKVFNPYDWANFDEYLCVQKESGHTAAYMDHFQKKYANCGKCEKEDISLSQL